MSKNFGQLLQVEFLQLRRIFSQMNHGTL